MKQARPQSGDEHREHPATPHRRFSSSGKLTPLLVGIFCAILLAAAWERGRGNLHYLQTKVVTPKAVQPEAPSGPGGQDVLRLTRSATTLGSQPEFLSVTMLPGRGMEVLQITASLPSRGEVPLLFAPATQDITDILNGTGEDTNGARGTTFGAAFSVPWAGAVTGTAVAGASPSVHALWRGQMLSFPAPAPGATHSVEGMLLTRGSENVKTSVIPDGQSASAVFHVDATKQGWPTTFDVNVQVDLTGSDIDLKVTVTNTGHAAMPAGIGWHPYFAVPSGDRANALLTLPSDTVVSLNPRTGLPDGRNQQIDGSAIDFTRAVGTRLGSTAIDATYTSLLSGVYADGPIIELRDPDFNFGLRIMPQTPGIRSLRVLAPRDKAWISIEPSTNFSDPLGTEWKQPEDAGLNTLPPGQSFEWKLRLELSQTSAAMFH